MSLLTPDTGLLIWMVLIFAIVFFLLAKFGFPIITSSIDKRNEKIRESLRLADEAQQRLESLSQEQQALIDKAMAEQGRILKDASAARDKMIAQAKADAQSEAAKIISQARAEILQEKESALADVRSQVAALSVEVAQKVLRKNLSDDKEQLAFVDRILDEVVPDKQRS